MKKKWLIGFTAVAMSAVFCAGCGADGTGNWGPAPVAPGGLDFTVDGTVGEGHEDESAPNYSYGSVIEQGYYKPDQVASSYFSLDRNTAGYSMMRAQISNGLKISPDSVRTEELYNYFTYGYPAPEAGEYMKATAYLTDCPWNADSKLLTVGVKTEERVMESTVNNYVFLVDVSGSMSARVYGTNQTCIGLVKHGILTMLDGLGDNDAVSIVTYASGIQTELEPTRCTESGKMQIANKVNGLVASGATYGEGGLQLAYKNAEKYKSEGGNNRVILMTDGDFNIGMRSETALKEFIQEKAKSGVYLSVLGYGMGNMRDDLMQTLALNGNGNYAYIDSEKEAEKVLCEELNGMLTTVAKDAKAGITFRTDAVEEYRIIGYDMKIMSEDDFNNENKDAGEIGSNLCVTAVYEVKLKEGVEAGAEIADIAIRFKAADTGESKEIHAQAMNTLSDSQDALFIGCIAEFGLVLRDSKYRGSASVAGVLTRLGGMQEYLNADAYKAEFFGLVQKSNTQELYGK